MTVFVSMSPQTIYMSGLDPHGENMDIPVRVLDCDTITQVNLFLNYYFKIFLVILILESFTAIGVHYLDTIKSLSRIPIAHGICF